MSYAPTVVDRLSALKMALEQHGIVASGHQVLVIDEAIELITKQHRCLMSWLQANAPGGWIDDLRKRADAHTSSPDRNVEAVRTMLLKRSVVGLQKYGVTTERRDLSLYQWQRHFLQELLDAAIYLTRQMGRTESDINDDAPATGGVHDGR
ncbi:MAG: hypothetical protein C0434_07875 [Xanthomonadaceae bacterium]|nr:hypothetical protein [Xanthomonadaceae bacterium]